MRRRELLKAVPLLMAPALARADTRTLRFAPNANLSAIDPIWTTALVAQDKDRWPLAGDQLYIDMDLSKQNLPGGTRLAIGSVVLEVSSLPHTGCHKFVSRFGVEAMKFVNSQVGRELCLRGINARVVQGGIIRVGNKAAKL